MNTNIYIYYILIVIKSESKIIQASRAHEYRKMELLGENKWWDVKNIFFNLK